ncbi:PREDICTED: putative disease resistance RPP13-like protein 1 [Nelumbo nucifera]|uniref:Disease resistance RPP13-like protein 1 n=2 Tax=Nelumbo nucifera TaxID=4432 RepID=A0A1U8Q475_NELNU|nr:PREDICTED: putative disease resistance RPP13-like protein 1 [Nelumbo nucifera]XP_010257214.1 PREDICTED: putative disease resistance RPP13-like protein 1 [Nelumbo nucifera]XP_010257215.1 PREDICTED: putative disease resistance RPP13-like protein 1 [Nelumbo nucifera]XP_010257216.1 PREDICTED: putative disease resistance RPP13-like protein 1 [Nelumbo nucifera]XP_010257217.1 PREDICTED: putative disease resistance RPP13-like protein 1 [Nelumbo nucifera]XP_019053412.1 PREDICTED: putative disease re
MYSYWGIKFPSWMIKPSVLPNLVRIVIGHCRRCECFEIFGPLPFLKDLELHDSTALKKINVWNWRRQCQVQGGDASSSIFPSLKKLFLRDMPNLEEWCGAGDNEDAIDGVDMGVPLFPLLSSLEISNCPKLETIPPHPTVEKMELYHCSGQQLQSTLLMKTRCRTVDMTTTTTTSSQEDFKGFPLPAEKKAMQGLISLRTLTIKECSNLTSLSQLQGLQYLTALEELQIEECPDFCSLEGIQALTAPKELTIESLPKLQQLPQDLENLQSLRDLRISHCPFNNVEGLGTLPSLQSLEINDVPDLVSLPQSLGNLKSLQHLQIYYIPNLESLPEETRQLTRLRDLRIYGCPHLEERCSRETGEDWPKISHVPCVEMW